MKTASLIPITALAGLVIALIFSTIIASAADEATRQRIKTSIGNISEQISVILPGTTTRWEPNTNAPYAVYAELKADRSYKVRVQPKGKNLPQREIDVRGPEPDGFSIRVRICDGKYNETLIRPLEPSFKRLAVDPKPDFYSETVLTEFLEHDVYMVADIQFGEKTDLEALAQSYALLKQAIGAAIKEGRSR